TVGGLGVGDDALRLCFVLGHDHGEFGHRSGEPFRPLVSGRCLWWQHDERPHGPRHYAITPRSATPCCARPALAARLSPSSDDRRRTPPRATLGRFSWATAGFAHASTPPPIPRLRGNGADGRRAEHRCECKKL